GLKKQELIFARELEAGAAFMKLHQEIFPKYSFPEMDWHDACVEVAHEFDSHSERLQGFLLAHGAIISKAARSKIARLQGRAGTDKCGEIHEGEAPKDALDAAGKFLEGLSEVREQILDEIRSWESNAAPA